MSNKIAAMGDFQLGFKQYGMEIREQDFRSAFARVIQCCIDQEIKVFIIAGDLYNAAKPSGDLVYFVKEQVDKLHANHIEVYGIDGNHDISTNFWLRLADIEPLHGRSVNCVNCNITLAGLNWCRPNLFYSELGLFVKKLRDMKIKHVDYFVFHQLFDEFIPFQAGIITATGVSNMIAEFTPKAVLLGDLHDSVQLEVGGIPFVYTGSSELNSVNEKENKFLAIIEDSKVNRIPLVTRSFIHKYIQTEKDLDGLLAAYPREVEKMPVLFIEYDNDAKELAKRASNILKENKALFRLLPLVKADNKSILAQLTHDADLSRNNTIGYLKEAVESCFDPKSDEYQLIFQLINSPDDISDVIDSYSKSKNL
ncbi:DNA repair exonuclease [Verrucomicrobiota bacterium]